MTRTPRWLPLVFALSVTSSASKPAPDAMVVEPHHSLVAHLVGGSLESYHYASRPIDDEISERWLERYLQMVDPSRMYLMAADVAAYRARKTELDDDVKGNRPRLRLALAVYDQYRQRVRAVAAVAERELSEPMTFDDPGAVIPIPGDDVDWPATHPAWEGAWRGRIRAEVLDALLADASRTEPEAREIVAKRYQRRTKLVEQVEPTDVIEVYLTALTSVYDPHSAYFKPASSDDFEIRMRDALEGIGAELRSIDGYTEISRLIPGGPAEASGLLKRGDRIVAVAQGDSDAVDVVDMRLDDVVKLIRGAKGSEVRLTIRPGGAVDRSQTRVVSIVRDRVQLERASAKGKVLEVSGADGVARKVGVVEVPSFYFDGFGERRPGVDVRSTTRDVERAVLELRAQGVESLVLDLRGNGGGPLPEAVTLAGLFIDKGPVVQIRDPWRGAEVLPDKQGGVVWAGPLVVLTDELSASASEIVAGALQDYRRAIVVGGPQTHGKGTVQSVIDLGAVMQDGRFRDLSNQAGALKLTVQKFYRVSGGSNQNIGIVPDIVLPSPWQGIDVLESDLDDALPWDEIAPAKYTPLPMTLDLDPLRAASASRVASEQAFQWIAEDRAEREAREARTQLSLHFESRKAEREQATEKHKARLASLGRAAEDLPASSSDPDDEDEFEEPPLHEIYAEAILQEASRIAVDLAEVWTPPPSLLKVESAVKAAGR
jgi:carboxyl-terminal processing protease